MRELDEATKHEAMNRLSLETIYSEWSHFVTDGRTLDVFGGICVPKIRFWKQEIVLLVFITHFMASSIGWWLKWTVQELDQGQFEGFHAEVPGINKITCLIIAKGYLKPSINLHLDSML